MADVCVASGTPLDHGLRLSYPQLEALQRAALRRDAAQTIAMTNAVHVAAAAIMGPEGGREFRKFTKALRDSIDE